MVWDLALVGREASVLQCIDCGSVHLHPARLAMLRRGSVDRACAAGSPDVVRASRQPSFYCSMRL